MHTILSIAGSDSSGGAGIQADLKTMTALGAYGMTAVTALTAQNTIGVTDIEPVSPEFLRMQLDAVFSDIPPDAVKIGMVSSIGQANVIADALTRYNAINIVIDPVMVATSGASLSGNDRIWDVLLPLATLATPNIPEAEALLNGIMCDYPYTVKNTTDAQGALSLTKPHTYKIDDAYNSHDAQLSTNSCISGYTGTADTKPAAACDDANTEQGLTSNMTNSSGSHICDISGMENAARLIGEKYGIAVLVKGGHLANSYCNGNAAVAPRLSNDSRSAQMPISADDVLYTNGRLVRFHGKRIDNPNTHGTGCTLSSAITVFLAQGCPLEDAIRQAKEYLAGAIGAMLDLGAGAGPLNHMYRMASPNK